MKRSYSRYILYRMATVGAQQSVTGEKSDILVECTDLQTSVSDSVGN